MRWERFLMDEHGKESSSRLLQFLAWMPATGVLLWIHTTEAMSLYLSGFVLNKGIEHLGKKGGKDVVSKRA